MNFLHQLLFLLRIFGVTPSPEITLFFLKCNLSSLETISSEESESEPVITSFTKSVAFLNTKPNPTQALKQKENTVHFWEDEDDFLVVGPGQHLFEFKTDWDAFEIFRKLRNIEQFYFCLI